MVWWLILLIVLAIHSPSYGWRSVPWQRHVKLNVLHAAEVDGHWEVYNQFQSEIQWNKELSFYPDKFRKSPVILLLPPFFAEEESLQKEVSRLTNQNSTHSVMRRECVLKYANNTAHCLLAETPYEDNYCVFLENSLVSTKQMQNVHEWLRKNVDSDRFEPMITLASIKAQSCPKQSPDPAFRIGSNVPQSHVLVSGGSYLMKVSLLKKDHNQIAQRLLQDQGTVPLPMFSLATKRLKKMTRHEKKKSSAEDGVEVAEAAESPAGLPLYVTDDDMFLEDLVSSEEPHASAII